MSSMFCSQIYRCKNKDWCARDFNPKSENPKCFEPLTNADRIRAMWNEQLNIAETVTDFLRNSKWLNTRDKRTLAQFRDAVVCVDSPIGEYRCQVKIYFSPQSGREPICVDTCLQHEIHELIYKHNVNTIGSCCGHGRKQAFIQVSPLSVPKMHELGYEALPEIVDKEGNIIGSWCFKPKTYLLDNSELLEE